MRDIGKNIRDLRVKQKMTQDELAEKLFVTRQTVSNYETGKREIPTRFVIALADYYKTTTDYILGRTKKKKSVIRRIPSVGGR